MTTSVTGYTVEKSQEIWDDTVVSATLSSDGNLILHTHDGTQLNAGPLASNIERISTSIVTLGSIDYALEDVIVPEWVSGTPNPVVVPSTLPTGSTTSVAWSPDCRYLVATNLTTSPYLSIYVRRGDVFTRLPDPATPASSMSYAASWSPDGQYLSMGHLSSPYLSIYKRAGNVFTKLPNPAVLPADACSATAWSPDGQYLAVDGGGSSPYVMIYKRSGDTFTKLPDPSSAPGGFIWGAAWSSNGKYLAFAHNSGGGTDPITIYKRSGDTFTKVDTPVFPFAVNYANSVSWSPDSQYLAVAVTPNSEYVYVFKRSGDTFTKLDAPDIPIPSNGRFADWSPDGKYLVVGHGGSSNNVSIYELTSDKLVKVLSPTGISSIVNSCRWSPDGVYLAVSYNDSPYLTIYKSSMGQVNPPISTIEILP